MNSVYLAKWFLDKNPVLKVPCIDSNIILNKLLYFSDLMNYSINKEHLVNEGFEKWDNGPVCKPVYTNYRYDNLASTNEKVDIKDKEILKILEIVNFIYSYKSAKELSDETHTHSIWINTSKNELMDFSKIEDKEKNLMINFYNMYKDIDFEDIKSEKINGNLYYYDKNNLEITDDLIQKLMDVEITEEPIFIEYIDDELVFS